VTSGCYADMITTFVTDKLTATYPQVNEATWFQDGATSHTTRVSMDAIRLLSQITLPSGMVIFIGLQGLMTCQHVTLGGGGDNRSP
jgi:hypothetical protein